MLELVRGRLNRTDDAERYAASIREHPCHNGGRLDTQGRIPNKVGHPCLR